MIKVYGTEIKREMRKQGIKGVQMAKEIGMTLSRMYQILNSPQVNVRSQTLGKICVVLNKPAEKFIIGLEYSSFSFDPQKFMLQLAKKVMSINILAHEADYSISRILTASRGNACAPTLIKRICKVLEVEPRDILREDAIERWEKTHDRA